MYLRVCLATQYQQRWFTTSRKFIRWLYAQHQTTILSSILHLLHQFLKQTRTCVGEPVDQLNEEEHKAGMVSFCCIDWPSLVNVTLLRLWKLRRALQDQATDTYASPAEHC